LRWGPTPSACHRSLTLAALIRDDCPLSLRLRWAPSARHRSLTLAALIRSPQPLRARL